MEKTIEQYGRSQKASTKKKIAKALTGSKNPAYKDGRRSYRNVVNAKKGEHVHHKNGKSSDNRPSNLEKFKESGPSRARHEKIHKRAENFKSNGGTKKVKRGYKAKRLKR